MTELQITWFFMIGFLLTVYAILDGFDLGVGFWSLFTKERDQLIKTIEPFWDGNEVWLLTGGGALFAAFPDAYSTVFSAFYLPIMIIIFSLIFRAVSIEFRKYHTGALKRMWEILFGLGSLFPAVLFGVVFGNILTGIPLDETKNFTGTFSDLLNPYAVLIGLLSFAMFITQGALYLSLKLDGDLAKRARNWASISWMLYLILFVISFVIDIITQRTNLTNYKEITTLALVPLMTFFTIASIEILNNRERKTAAFVSSTLSICGFMAMIGITIFPNLVPAVGYSDLSLSIANASSSELTLKTMLIIAGIGMPFVVAYTIWIYYKFRRSLS